MVRAFLILTLLILLFATALSQTAPVPGASRSDGEFRFARLAYSSNPRYQSRRRQAWQTDWPDAEHHLLNGVRRMTMVDAARDGHVIAPGDPKLFDYPFAYAVEVGHWYLSDDDALNLRKYMLRGGFLIVDDFHGEFEWMAFRSSVDKVFPDRPIVDIPDDDEAFHVLYDLDQRIQIPGRSYIGTGLTYQRFDGFPPRWRGIYDDDGRLMMAINFNMDLGDAWEHADWPEYPENMTALAYRFGINYIIYAMTH